MKKQIKRKKEKDLLMENILSYLPMQEMPSQSSTSFKNFIQNIGKKIRKNYQKFKIKMTFLKLVFPSMRRKKSLNISNSSIKVNLSLARPLP